MFSSQVSLTSPPSYVFTCMVLTGFGPRASPHPHQLTNSALEQFRRALVCLGLQQRDKRCMQPEWFSQLKPHQRVAMVGGMRDILWTKDAMCNTITSIDTLPSMQNVNGRFRYTIPCYVLPRDGEKLRVDMDKNPDKTQRYMVKPLGRGEGHGIFIGTTYDEVRAWATTGRPAPASPLSPPSPTSLFLAPPCQTPSLPASYAPFTTPAAGRKPEERVLDGPRPYCAAFCRRPFSDRRKEV